MLPPGCPSWEYSNHPQRHLLRASTAQVLTDLAEGRLDTLRISADSRPIHLRLFAPLAPQGHSYYAGHYRGESFRCLRRYEVGVAGDPNVGYPAAEVIDAMDRLARDVIRGATALDKAHQLPLAQVPHEQRLLYAVVFTCRVFVELLAVHPFANGNGHAARFVIWALLGRYGYWPRRWPIEPRPADPPYTDLITEYRRGNREKLEDYVLACIEP